MRRLSLVALPLVALAVGSAASEGVAADHDPMQLLRDSAEAASSPDSVSVTLEVSTKLVRGEQTDEMSADFLYRTAPGGRFEFVSVDPDGDEPRSGYLVVGNSDVTLTALLSRRRHMLEPTADGITAFVRSPGPTGIGSGLGGLALAFLHPVAIQDPADSVTASEFVGEETVDDEQLLHARYTVGGGIEVDVWYRAEGTPLVRRIQPNVLDNPGIQQMAQQYDSFDYQLTFEFKDWNTDAALTEADIRVVEPENSQLMASFYQPPEPTPHHLLGEAAPTFELPTPGGERVSLEKEDAEGATLLEFWATSCPICVQAMPALEKLHEEYAAKGLSYYAVNVGEAPGDVAAFLEARGLTPTALLDESMEVADDYGVQGIPLILLVDSGGRVQVAVEGYGPTLPAKLSEQIEATLRGEDLATAQLAEFKEAEAQRTAESDRLRSLLDG